MQPWIDTGLRAATMDATRGLLVRDGYESLSMRRIASVIGCSVSSIYLYFDNKDELVHALIDEGFERWYEIVRTGAEIDASPRERLEAHCVSYIEFGIGNPEFYEIMYMFHPRRMARFPKELYRRASRSMDVLTRLVQDCAPEHFRDAEEARVHAHVVWAILHGVVSTMIAQRLDIRLDRDVYIATSARCAVDMVCRLDPSAV